MKMLSRWSGYLRFSQLAVNIENDLKMPHEEMAHTLP